MIMRLFILILISLGVASHAHAQNNKNMFARNAMSNLENFDKQRVHWGYFLGFNFLDFKMDHIQNTEPIFVKSTTGFNVGLIGNLRLFEYLDLRFEPGLYYSQRNLEFPGFTTTVDALREVKSTYIMFPLLLKFSSKRTGNIRPYLIGGFSYAMNLSSNSQSLDDNSVGRFRMERITPNYELGFGIDLYFEYFKFSPSIRGVFGINDEIIRDNDPNSPWTGNIHAMRTRGVFLNFAFH
jgi:cbb3-type cytochrome oxidase subunit 3